MIRYKDVPLHGDLRISKSALPQLPEEFERIPDLLGNGRDAMRQYRGTLATHVLEYPYEWSVHRDYADPRISLLGHLILDTPEITAGFLAGVIAAARAYQRGDSLFGSLLRGCAAGFLTWAFTNGLACYGNRSVTSHIGG